MGYHILERIRGTSETLHVPLWKRLGIDYDLPRVPRDEPIPPNRVRLIVVKTVSNTGEVVQEIDEHVDWPVYDPYGPAAIEPYGRFPPDEIVERHRYEDAVDLIEDVAGTLPIPPDFAGTHGVDSGQYLECFITAVRPSGDDNWVVPYPAKRPSPTGESPAFDPADVRATVRQQDVEFD